MLLFQSGVRCPVEFGLSGGGFILRAMTSASACFRSSVSRASFRLASANASSARGGSPEVHQQADQAGYGEYSHEFPAPALSCPPSPPRCCSRRRKSHVLGVDVLLHGGPG